MMKKNPLQINNLKHKLCIILRNQLEIVEKVATPGSTVFTGIIRTVDDQLDRQLQRKLER